MLSDASRLAWYTAEHSTGKTLNSRFNRIRGIHSAEERLLDRPAVEQLFQRDQDAVQVAFIKGAMNEARETSSIPAAFV